MFFFRKLRFQLCLPLLLGLGCILSYSPKINGQSADRDSRSKLIPVGIAKVDITPERPIRLSGYGSRTEPSEGIAQQLHAKALAIGSDNQLSVIVTVDSIGVPAWVCNELSARLKREVSLPRALFVVASSHSMSMS